MLAARRARSASSPHRRRRGPRRGRRPVARAHAPLRRGLRARSRGGQPAAARRRLAVPRRRDEARARRGRRAADQARPVERDRYLFYTACTRASERLYLVREAADDDGSPREASPFWHDVEAAFDGDDVRRWTRRRPLSALTWPLEEAPTERERLRALAELASHDRADAEALARANGWERRLERALAAFRRPDPAHAPARARTARLAHLVRRDGARALRRLLLGLVRRALPRSEDDRRRARREAARQCRPPGSLPLLLAHPGRPRRGEARAEATSTRRPRLMRALPRRGARGRADGPDRDAGAGARPDALARPRCVRRGGMRVLVAARAAAVRGLVRQRARRPGAAARARARRRADALGEDRPHRRRPVRRPRNRPGLQVRQDAHSARQIESELRLQIPLYMLVLRDLVGLEPLGGLYRPLAGARSRAASSAFRGARRCPGYV